MTQPETTSEVEKQEPQSGIAEALDKKTEEAGKGEVKKVEEEAPKKEKTYTQGDWDKRQGELDGRISGLDKKLTETTKSSKDEVGRLETALDEERQRTLDAQDATYLRKVEADGGDLDVAKQTVRRERDSKTAEAANTKKARELQEQETILAEAGKAKKATDLIKEHELEADIVDELLACETPEAMENKALKLRIEKGVVDAKPIVKTDAPEGGQKTDTSNMSIEERMGQAMEGKI